MVRNTKFWELHDLVLLLLLLFQTLMAIKKESEGYTVVKEFENILLMFPE